MTENMTEAWTYRPDDEGNEWTRLMTDEEVVESVRGAMDQLALRELFMLLHRFGWPGDVPWAKWVGGELSAGRDYRRNLIAERARIGELETEIKALNEQLATRRKRTAKRKAGR